MKVPHLPSINPATLTPRKNRIFAALVLLGSFVGSLATAQAAIYNFELDGPNTARDGQGNVIAVTGTGRFDTTQKTVAAHGSYTVTNTNGVVVSKGTWAASKFIAFKDTGGLISGFWTGDLAMEVALWSKLGTPIPGTLPMTVYCEPGETPG